MVAASGRCRKSSTTRPTPHTHLSRPPHRRCRSAAPPCSEGAAKFGMLFTMTAPTVPARASDFDYDEAFSRNIGWVTEWEQQILRTKRVAIAGMGGVGGLHLLTLARLGIGAFNISDMDVFETVNFNRQVGASIGTLGRPKVDVMAGMALDINPTAEIRRFPNGINDDNIDDFLNGV